jgi:type I restriction enzyme M protein
MNLLLHGVPFADIHHGDTLTEPRHKNGGELRRYHRVMANPPFSQNYEIEDMKHKERFKFGWAPETGKKADLMFIQHMWSVLMPDGLLISVMPHGVLFRGGKEKEIRKGFIDGVGGEDGDLIEAVIGLPQNLFYGTSIPACLIVMRQNGKAKPAERRGKILFINADREFYEGRAQNYLLPEHTDKIAATYEQWREMPGYSKIVTLDEIRRNDYNLNIRRYADNAPPPEPQDVYAHLQGGIPESEVQALTPLFAAHGMALASHLKPQCAGYLRYPDAITSKADLKALVENDAPVQKQEATLHNALTKWWEKVKLRIAGLPRMRRMMDLHKELLSGFNTTLLPLGIFDTFKLDGIFVSWWEEHVNDLKILLAAPQGQEATTVVKARSDEIAAKFSAPQYLVMSWLEALKSALEESDEKGSKIKVEMKNEPLVVKLLPQELAQLEKLEQKLAELEGSKAQFDAGPTDEAEEWEPEEEGQEYGKYLEDQLKAIKAKLKNQKANTRLKAECDALEAKLAPLAALKKSIADTKAKRKTLLGSLMGKLESKVLALTEAEAEKLYLELFYQGLSAQLMKALLTQRQQLIAALENWWEKYQQPYTTIAKRKADATHALEKFMKELGYAA